MQKICFFNSIKFWGGGEKLHLENAIEFKKKGYYVCLLSKRNSPLWKKAEEHKLPTFPITVSNLSFLNPIKIIKLVSFYKKQQIDTVIFSSSQDLKVGAISAKLAGVKKIVYLRGLAVPVKANLINRIIFSSLLTHIIANSDETRNNLLLYLGKFIDHKKIHTIYHGIDPIDYSSINKLAAISKNGHGVILGNAGRLTTQKGQVHLIQVAKKLKESTIDFSLFIAGTGELHSELQTLIIQNQLEQNVFLLGFVQDMESFMNSIDIFLLSSMWEGFGYVLVEAMIKAKPVVAFNMSSNPEIVLENKTGFLVDYPNEDLFYIKTKELIQDPILRNTMGAAGKQRVIEKFILKDRVTELVEYLEKN